MADRTTPKYLDDIATTLEEAGGVTPTNRQDATVPARLARIEAALGPALAQRLTEFPYIDFEVVDAPDRKEGRVFYDPVLNALTLYPAGTEVTHTLGHEILATVFNDTGTTLSNGKVLALDNSSIIPASVKLSDASVEILAHNTLGVATEDILPGTVGMATVLGVVNELDTSAWAVGTILYLSETEPGGFATEIPDSPSHNVVVATVVVQSATVGAIYVRPTERGNFQGILDAFNGAILESYTAPIVSSGGSITLVLDNEQEPGEGLSLIFDAGLSQFATPASVTLTPGTDVAPELNYVYIPQDTEVLTTSLVGFPDPNTGQYVPVATVLCQSAASAASDGVYKNHSWVDHISGFNNNGHLSHVNTWIRNQHATWLDGALGSITINTGPNPDEVFFDMASGSALQLHINEFSEIDSETETIYMVNDSVTPYKPVNDLALELTDAAGVTMNNKYYSLVFFGIVNSDGTSNVLVNLPIGSYSNASDASSDPDNLNVYTLPEDFRGTGFLVARMVFKHGSAGTHVLEEYIDLRGTIIGAHAGGGGGGGGASILDDLSDVDTTGKATNDGLYYDGVEWIPRSSIDVQIFNSSGTWTKPDGAKIVRFVLVGGGAGGGSGGTGTNDSGGGAGSGGTVLIQELFATDLSPTESIVIGPGGAGGATIGSANTQGNDGVDGTTSSLAGVYEAFGGNKGLGGRTTGGTAGNPGMANVSAMISGHSGWRINSGKGGAGDDLGNGGAGWSSDAGSGGGGGGGVAGGLSSNGGNGGSDCGADNAYTGGAGNKGLGSAAGNGGSGGAGPAASGIGEGGWGGGGGGGAGTSGNGGSGGVGGSPAGGGGGGGASNSGASGQGGAGSNGKCWVISYL